MKTLQNNFTTQAQSKLLLEMGVPADSADMYYQKIKQEDDYELLVGESIAIKHNMFSYRNGYTIPCWSVGRLIEISRICSTLPDEEWMFPFWRDQEDNIEWSIRVIESGIRTGNMDFSKLED